jgi:ABC-type Na+ transport system ATPase subunit NatA
VWHERTGQARDTHCGFRERPAQGVREKVVLDGVDLSIGEGEVFALLGPNGAGKTTTVQILSTLIPADAGTASVMGHGLRGEAGAVRAVIGVTGQFCTPGMSSRVKRRSETPFEVVGQGACSRRRRCSMIRQRSST